MLLRIDVDDPRRADVLDLLQRHLALAHAQSPPEDVHALDIDGLLDSYGTMLERNRTIEFR